MSSVKNLSKMLNDHLDFVDGKGGVQMKIKNKNLSYLDLVGLNLSKALMHTVEMNYTDISGANMFASFAEDSSFRHLVAHKTNFRESFIEGCDFSFSDLTDSNFRNANLEGSNFYRACLAGVDFKGARMKGVNFYGADFAGATIAEGQILTGKMYQIDGLGFDSDYLEIFQTLRGWYLRNQDFEGDSNNFSLNLRKKYGSCDLQIRYKNIIGALCI
jgi:uncharacterized protein YjbI with pentapeptide repeats